MVVPHLTNFRDALDPVAHYLLDARLQVCVLEGHVPHAPVSRTVTTPVASSTSQSSMSPPSACRAGRMTSMVCSTRVRMRRPFNQPPSYDGQP